jgi:hypothetical protein
MPKNDYTAAEALHLLLERVAKAGDQPLSRVKHAIDSGKDVQEQQPNGKRRKRARTYRKHVAYSDEEAILVALGVLRAHFFELPVIVNSAIDAFKDTFVVTEPVGRHRLPALQGLRDDDGAAYGREKTLAIEIETEATLVKNQLENVALVRYGENQIDEMRKILDDVRHLVSFGENNGDSSGS